jgi:hypothetical protein
MKIRKNGDLRGLPSVRVIGTSGEMLGVLAVSDALRLALREGLDLVEVNPRGQPPVCKLLDFSKYKYEDAKRAAKKRLGAPLLVFLVRSKLTIRGRPGAFLVGDLVTGEAIRQGMLACVPGAEGVVHEIPILAVEFVDHRSEGVSELGLHVVGRTAEEEQAVEDLDGPYLLDVVDRPS